MNVHRGPSSADLTRRLTRKAARWDEAAILPKRELADLLPSVPALPVFIDETVYGTPLSQTRPLDTFITVVPPLFILIGDDGKQYLVDTQGYDYARYIARLV